MNSNKFWTILLREYTFRVKKRSFLLFTFLTPILGIFFILVLTLLITSTGDGEQKVVVVLDSTNKYASYLTPDSQFKFISASKDLEEYRKANDPNVFAYVQITGNLMENPGAIRIYSDRTIPEDLKKKVRADLTPVVYQEKLNTYNIPNLEKIIQDSKVRLDISSVRWDSGGEKNVSSSFANGVGQLLNILIYLFVMMYGMMVMQGVREEKKSRLVEIIISSVTPKTLLFGKIVGIGLVGLTQMALWAILFVIGFIVTQLFFLSTASFNLSEISQRIAVEAPNISSDFALITSTLGTLNIPFLIVAFFVYFICGYFIYASVYAAIGASVDSDEDLNQTMAPMSILLVLGLYLGIYAANNPDSTLALWTSVIPLTSPMVMMVRLLFNPPWWQILLSLLILVASTILLVWCAAKIFRVGILMYGKKPSLKEFIQWIRFR